MVQHRPNFENAPSEESDIRIAYDEKYLWVGAKLYMKDANRIYEATKKRDERLYGVDAFGIVLDSYNDNETGLAFFTAPTGLRTDYAISNDGAGMGGPGFGSTNYSWNTFWDVEVTRDDKGWYVEMRIPFSSLKFKPEGATTTMGLIVVRNISQHNETVTFPSVDPKYGYMATSKPSIAQKVSLEGIKADNPVYVSPYAIGGYSRDWSLNEAETAYELDDTPKFNAGLDVKYNINSNLTLDLTANTDFAQVEADDQQVNLTRYSLFFPEKRMFFQERSSLFSFGLGGMFDNLFYSRNIGLNDGEQIRIYGGARLTGRMGNWDVGLIDMQTAESGDIAGENFGVLRMRRQVINPNSYVGGIVTSRIGLDGRENLSYGLDGIFRLFGDDYLDVKWAQSYDDEMTGNMASLDPSFMMVNWERRSEEGFAYVLNYTYLGEEFNPGIGFIMRNGVQGFQGRALYGWLPGEESKIFNTQILIDAERYARLEDGSLEAMKIAPGFEVNTKKNLHLEIGLEYQKEGVFYDFNISDSLQISGGEYAFTGVQTRIGTSNSKKISLRGGGYAGQFYDGRRIGFQSETNFNLSSSFIFSPGYEFNNLYFSERSGFNRLNIHSFNVKAQVMISTKLSATALVQYVNTEDDFIANFRLRYNPREGNDFYLVYNDYRGFRGENMQPVIPGFYNKTILVKYTHTFIL
ncbi:MAG: DUF5916 domain-containing protein [Bacteroidales bacterium]